MAQDLGACELLGRFPLGKGGRRLGEVGAVELDPSAARLHERPRFGCQPRHLGGGELHVVEDHRPLDVAQLRRADDTLRGRGPQSQGGSGPAARELRHPHVEAGRREGRAGDGHELPRLVLRQEDLSPPAATGAEQLGHHSFQPLELGGDGCRVLAVGQRHLDRKLASLGPRAEHRQEPGVALVGGRELHDELGAGDPGDGLGPRRQASSERRRRRDGRRELRPVELGEHGCGDVARRAYVWRRGW